MSDYKLQGKLSED